MIVLVAFLAVLSALAGCAPVPLESVETRPSGEYAEVLTFRATASESGGPHVLKVGIDIDPAKLMGWAKGNRAYTTGIAAKLTGPGLGDGRHATLYLPITDQQEVGREGSVTKVAFLPSGTALPNGFKRGELHEAFRFDPEPGEYTLTLEMRTVNNADQLMIKAIRNVRLEVLGPKSREGALTGWARVP